MNNDNTDYVSNESGTLSRLFKLPQHGTTVRTELIAGMTTEESPENKTGIVRCDLIDCANNFKEITTMPARSLCQNFLNN
ncbi:hypothetical protein, partial [Escherichia coli]